MNKNKVLIDGRVCPWWLLPTFDNPLRRLFHKPEGILVGLVQPGDRVADIGCGMGYFTITLARMVGESGRVIAVDLQPRMLEGLKFRAQRAGLLHRIELRQASSSRLGIDPPIDFALAFWMVHETVDQHSFLQTVFELLRPGACLLVVEPRIHVSEADFNRTHSIAGQIGFEDVPTAKVSLSRALLLRKSNIRIS